MGLEYPLHFFMGANSPTGFVCFSDEMTDMAKEGRLFFIKGGSGCGKSTLMQRAAEKLSICEPYFEYIHCASDPDSLDGILFPASGTGMLDATPPHAIEPQAPGACETVINLCSCWDEDYLQSKRAAVLSIKKQNAACHQQCVRFISAAHSLLSDNMSIALDCLDTEKIAKTAAGIVARECRKKHGVSIEKQRFLSAITPKGNVGFAQTIAAFPKVYYIKDPYGAASSLLLAAIRSLLLQAGVTMYTCFCPLNPHGKIDHLLIPELGLAFITGIRPFTAETIPEPYRVISFTRFTDLERLARRKQRLRFNRRAAEELLDAASRSLRRAKGFHEAIEKIYGEAMDFEAVNRLGEEAIQMALDWQTEKLAEQY